MRPALTVHRYADAAAFLEAAESFLLKREVENALILGIAHAARADPASVPIAPYFATVEGNDGPRLAAFQTVPAKLGITRGDEPAAIQLLARDVHEARPGLSNIHGPEPTVRHFAEALGRSEGRSASLQMPQCIYDLESVIPPARPAGGRLRLADDGDLALLTRWVAGFLADIGDHGDPPAVVRDRVRSKQFFLWEDGEPRSMAGWSGKTPNGVRVNFVYTPLEFRGCGYASSTVAALSERLLAEGNRFCCLFTDLGNPTSNAIYQRIGYRPVADMALYRLSP